MQGADPASQHDRTKKADNSHFARARRMTELGYRDLLRNAAL
jgi:hypothetical protein